MTFHIHTSLGFVPFLFLSTLIFSSIFSINLHRRSCYYQLRQLRVVSHSLSPAAASTLVHAFVVSRLDYCSAIYEELPTCRLKCLDRVLWTAARLVGRIPRFGRVSGYMRDVLSWLPYPQRIVYCISALVRYCIEGLAPSYLRELCWSTVTIQRRISLRCSAQAVLLVPRTWTVIRQRRAFSVAGPTAWNGLPVALHLTPVAHSALFLSSLKTTLLTEVRLGALLSRLPWRGAIENCSN